MTGTIQRNENQTMFRMICHLAWPAILESFFQSIVTYVDTAMVGRISAQASASVGVTSTVLWLTNAPIWAMAVGIVACVARAYGAGETEKARTVVSQAAIIVLVLSTILSVITLSISPVLPAWMGAEEELRRDASWYFAIVCMPMLFRVSNILFGSVLRGIGEMRTSMIINLIMNVVNIVGNFFLIYETRVIDLGGLELLIPGAGFGVHGAAMATAFAWVTGGTAMFIRVMRHKALRPGKLLAYDRSIMMQCIRIGIPVTGQRIASSLGHVMFTALITSLGTVALATHTIAMTVEELFYIVGLGMQSAATTLAGNALGEGDIKKLNHMSKMSTVLTVVLMTFSGILLFVLAEPMMRIFSKDEAVIAGGMVVLRIVAVSEPLFGLRIILEGLFNGVGETRLPFVDSLISMWGVRVLFTAICIHLFDLGLNAVWCCMVGDNVVCALMMTVQYYGGKWKKRAGI